MNDDDTVIPFKPPSPTDGITDGLPDLAPLGDGFKTGFNLRNWFQAALERSGAKFQGGSVGDGDVDLDIEIDGYKYLVKVYTVESK